MPVTGLYPSPTLDVPPLKNPPRIAPQVSIMDITRKEVPTFDGGQSTFIHLLSPRVDFHVVMPAIASCLLTLFRRERLLGET